MKIYISDKAIEKLKQMINNQKYDSISVRKFNKDKHPVSNLFKGIKLTEKQREEHKTGKAYSIYINNDKLKKIDKYLKDNNISIEGGILPFLPVILGIISGLATLGSAGATVANTVINAKKNDAELQEQERHNRAMETGSAITLRAPWKNEIGNGVKEFFSKSKLDDIGQRTSRCYMKNLYDNFDITYDKEGGALTLRNLQL